MIDGTTQTDEVGKSVSEVAKPGFGEGKPLPPFRLEPVFVERVWGSLDLRPWYPHVNEKNAIGEVWLTGDACRVLTGPLAGSNLGDVFALHSRAMLGPVAADCELGASPLLIKVIFATQKLSVQVHPDDRLAQKYGELRGKTECWYVLEAEPGAQVAVGLTPDATMDHISRGVADGSLESSLQILGIETGEMIFVDAGTVHAIWPGSVLLETQQNCDITYRLYDYGRSRELHLEKATEAIRLQTAAGKVTPVTHTDRTVLVDQAYFCVEKVHGVPACTDETAKPEFQYLFAARGAGRVVPINAGAFDGVDLPPQSIVAIPYFSPAWRIEPAESDQGNLELIRILARHPDRMTDAGAETLTESAQ